MDAWMGWVDLHAQMYSVYVNRRFGVLTWPSGRTTTEVAASTVVVSQLEASSFAGGAARLRDLKEANARETLDAFCQRASDLAARGWWIRRHGRGRRLRARRVVALDWKTT